MKPSDLKRYTDAANRSSKWHRDHIAAMKKCRFDTIAVHGIYSMQEALDFNQGAIMEPLYLSSSQAYRDSDEMEAALSNMIPSWCYSRIANPTVYYFEGVMALLEAFGCDAETTCCATSSGMSAIVSAINPLLTIDPDNPSAKLNFVAGCQLYGGTFQQFAVRKEKEQGIEWRKVLNCNDMDDWGSKIDENTRFLYGELPSNPALAFFDLKKLIDLGHSKGVPVIIDATVATPALLRPIELGADIVVQSSTKTLTASGLAISGTVTARKNITSNFGSPEMLSDYGAYVKMLPNRDMGPCVSPFNAMIALNDIRMLRSRVDILSKNSMKVATFLESHKHIEGVDYLGLKSHPLHDVSSKYLFLADAEHDDEYGKPVNRYGHLMSFRIKGGHEATRKVFDAFQMVWRATDLGRIKSVATIPSISTHMQQGEEGRALAQIPDNLIRLCVGAEHPEDIISDLARSLESLDGKVYPVSSPEFSAGGASSAKLGK